MQKFHDSHLKSETVLGALISQIQMEKHKSFTSSYKKSSNSSRASMGIGLILTVAENG